MENKMTVCPVCKKKVDAYKGIEYWGCCEDCITQEMRDKASKEDFEDNNSKCPDCKQYVANTYFDDNGICFDCVWGADVSEVERETDKELTELKNQKNKISRRISTLKKAQAQ